MPNTFQLLLLWEKTSADAERMAAKILVLEGYKDVDPQCPRGGPDGKKDIICWKDGKKFVVGCYFPGEQKKLKDIQEKFSDDYKGKALNLADGFVFITNQKITPHERMDLCSKFPSSEIFHGEFVCNILDSPKGYGVRLEYLDIEVSKSEQIAFLNSYAASSQTIEKIRDDMNEIRAVTNALPSLIAARDVGRNSFAVLPVSGFIWSSKFSVEDVLAIHRACLYDSDVKSERSQYGFRKTQVWIGAPGSNIDNAIFVPPPANEIPERIIGLLDRWRAEYIKVYHQNSDAKVQAIARFHADFLHIHPFLDGNGRVARVISSIQCRDLLGKEIRFSSIESEEEYYLLLQQADNGSYGGLVNLFKSLQE